ncbi:MAG: FliO/MopB family protein [Alphaproteobacteria bacterium]|nr:FliO/MopB family protein [Alphaproteobacteria bacterium]
MDLDQVFRGLLALVFVLGLIAGIAYLAKRFGFTPRATLPRAAARGGRRSSKGRRLGIVEVLPVDAKRRLILIRRDDKEHLILLGADRDTVVEVGTPAPDLVAEDLDEESHSVRSLLASRLGNGQGGQA